MNQDYNNNQNNLTQQGDKYIYNNQQQSVQTQTIEPTIENNYSTNNNYSNKNKPKRDKSELAFGFIVAIVIAFVVIFKIGPSGLSGSSGPDKLVCQSDKGNLTIMYNENELVGCEADGIDYDLEENKLEASKLGTEKYIIAMYSWFVNSKQGVCAVEGKSKNQIMNSPLIDELKEVHDAAKEEAALRSVELIVSGVELAGTSYMFKNGGNVVTSISDLKPYFTLENFEMTDEGIITEKEWVGSTKISCELKMVTDGIQVDCPNVKGYSTKIVRLK